MKKILLGAALMLASVAASAQVYVGGSLGFNRNTTDNATDITIAPEVGYNFNETWAVGGTLDYNYMYNSGMKTNVFGIAPYARYTYFRYDRVSLFVDGGFMFGMGKSKFEDYESETVSIFNIGFKPGVAFNLNDKFGLVAHFGFLGYQGGNDASKAVEINDVTAYPEKFGFDFSSMNLQLGFYVNF